MSKWVCLDGNYLLEEQATLPISDRGFLYGDGLFTTVRVHQGQVEFLQPHFQRLSHQCEQLGIHSPFIKSEWIDELIERNAAWTGTWRLKILVTGGEDPTLTLSSRAPGIVLLTLKPYRLEPFVPCRLSLYPDPIVRPLAFLKSLAYLDRLWVNHYAHSKDYDDAIVCNCEGYLLETAFSNLFWMDETHLYVPDSTLPYLQGILLNQLIDHLEFKVMPVKAGLEDIPFGAAVYICNSLAHVRPVIEIDRRLFQRQARLEGCLQKAIEKALHVDRKLL